MSLFVASDQVESALKNGEPIVALESTIITHGMPWPDNVETARAVERVVTDHGAVPATIAVIGGQLRVGLSDDELLALGQAEGVLKLSRADMAFAMASGATGSTTVAATMIAAHNAGISTFATGGIGGVHRGAEASMDISADLQELAQTPVNVVCSGAKAILDIARTLEVLETLGVPVFAFGQDEFPAFWSRTSGLMAPLRCDEPELIAQSLAKRTALALPGGQLIANPIPESDEIKPDVLAPIIKWAVKEAEGKSVTAKDVTPFLLQQIFDLTSGQSLVANIALIKNNAKLAAEIAIQSAKA